MMRNDMESILFTEEQLREMPYVCHQNWKTNSSVGVF